MAPANKPTAAKEATPDTSDRNPGGIYKGTREDWLTEAMLIMGEWLNTILHTENLCEGTGKNLRFTSIAKKLKEIRKTTLRFHDFKPKFVRVSCSLQDTGMTQSRALAHVHLKHATGNQKHEIRMGVHVGGRKTKARSCRVADILLHEMIHTCFPMDGHRGGFRTLSSAVGLLSPMTATTASEALTQRIKKEVVDVLGKYPHAPVKLIPRGQRKKGSRLVLCECYSCGCKVRLTRMWINYAETNNNGQIECPMGCNVGGMVVED
jgi:hypothetical protein